MKFEFLDYIIFGLCNLIVVGFLIVRFKDRRYEKLEKLIVTFLWVTHFIFSFVFADYIIRNGGDSIRYWEITADASQYASTWMGYFGVNTFFIQWLNYIPYKVFGLSYLSGTMIYATLSYAGLVLFFEGIRDLISTQKESLAYPQFLYLPLFLPGLHFWTSGVSKESLLFLGLTLMFYSFSKKKQVLVPALLGWALCLLVRPFVGFVFLPILIYFLLSYLRKRSFVFRFRVIVLMALLLFKAGQHFLAYMHLEEISWDRIRNLSDAQFGFLTDFDANTEILMRELNFLERWIAVSFRPFIWESWDFNSLIFALENAWLFLIMVLGISLGWKKSFQIPLSVKYYAIIASGMFLVFTFTLNNMGLFYRMKSIWLPFLHITFLWLICASIPSSKPRQ
jgi:hypothetical protein